MLQNRDLRGSSGLRKDSSSDDGQNTPELFCDVSDGYYSTEKPSPQHDHRRNRGRRHNSKEKRDKRNTYRESRERKKEKKSRYSDESNDSDLNHQKRRDDPERNVREKKNRHNTIEEKEAYFDDAKRHRHRHENTQQYDEDQQSMKRRHRKSRRRGRDENSSPDEENSDDDQHQKKSKRKRSSKRDEAQSENEIDDNDVIYNKHRTEKRRRSESRDRNQRREVRGEEVHRNHREDGRDGSRYPKDRRRDNSDYGRRDERGNKRGDDGDEYRRSNGREKRHRSREVDDVDRNRRHHDKPTREGRQRDDNKDDVDNQQSHRRHDANVKKEPDIKRENGVKIEPGVKREAGVKKEVGVKIEADIKKENGVLKDLKSEPRVKKEYGIKSEPRGSKDAYSVKRERGEPAPNVKSDAFGRAVQESKDAEKKDKEKPNFALSGALGAETNTYKGVVIKYGEPAEARVPKTKWRLYAFKGEEKLPILHIHRQSAYLLGRERRIVDIPTDHPSCSKQHAVLQYKLASYKREDGRTARRVQPYIIDLGSANGTYVNGDRIDAQKYVQLLEKDVLKFGFSSREYVLLRDDSVDSDEPDAD